MSASLNHGIVGNAPQISAFMHKLISFLIKLVLIKIFGDQIIIIFSYFPSLSLFFLDKNAGSCCCFINLQPTCFSSLFLVKYELACVKPRQHLLLGTSVVSKFSTAKPVPFLLESMETAIFSNKRELKQQFSFHVIDPQEEY